MNIDCNKYRQYLKKYSFRNGSELTVTDVEA